MVRGLLTFVDPKRKSTISRLEYALRHDDVDEFADIFTPEHEVCLFGRKRNVFDREDKSKEAFKALEDGFNSKKACELILFVALNKCYNIANWLDSKGYLIRVGTLDEGFLESLFQTCRWYDRRITLLMLKYVDLSTLSEEIIGTQLMITNPNVARYLGSHLEINAIYNHDNYFDHLFYEDEDGKYTHNSECLKILIDSGVDLTFRIYFDECDSGANGAPLEWSLHHQFELQDPALQYAVDRYNDVLESLCERGLLDDLAAFVAGFTFKFGEGFLLYISDRKEYFKQMKIVQEKYEREYYAQD